MTNITDIGKPFSSELGLNAALDTHVIGDNLTEIADTERARPVFLRALRRAQLEPKSCVAQSNEYLANSLRMLTGSFVLGTRGISMCSNACSNHAQWIDCRTELLYEDLVAARALKDKSPFAPLWNHGAVRQ